MDQPFDVIIVGAGLAGLRAAIELGQDARVAVVTKVFATRSHSGAAQGGIGAAIGNEEEDNWQWHMFDTVKGSDYLGDQDAIEIMARDAPRVIYELEHMGVPFNRTAEGKIAQRAFGGHTREFGTAAVKRACFAADRTGRVILDTLWEKCLQQGIAFLHEFHITSLLVQDGRCCGVVAYELATGKTHVLKSKALLLATGGAGKIFKTTSNAMASTGDGMAIAYRSGAPLQDMEFVQFHPTGIYKLGILISEAARGEGGVLRNKEGERFMERYAPVIKDLAPRDMVSRCILEEVRAGRGIDGNDYVHQLSKARVQDALRPIDQTRNTKGSERIGDIQSDMQQIMMRNVSVFRQADDLQKTLDLLVQLKERYTRVGLTDSGSRFNRERMDYLELGYMLDLARAVTMGALWRRESRGAHFREDFPTRDDDTFLAHSLVALDASGTPRQTTRPVAITRFEPKERTY